MDIVQQGLEAFDPEAAERLRQARLKEQRMQDARERYSRVPVAQVAGPSVQDLAYNIQRSQAQHLQGMANDTMDALEKENYSRVSQAREARRQDHELRLQKMALDAMLARVAMERQSAEEQRAREAKMRFDSGMGGTRTFRDGGWDYS